MRPPGIASNAAHPRPSRPILQPSPIARILLPPHLPVIEVVTTAHQKRQHILKNDPALIERRSHRHHLKPRPRQRPIRINHRRRDPSHQTRLAVASGHTQRSIPRRPKSTPTKPRLPTQHLKRLTITITAAHHQTAQIVDQRPSNTHRPHFMCADN